MGVSVCLERKKNATKVSFSLTACGDYLVFLCDIIKLNLFLFSCHQTLLFIATSGTNWLFFFQVVLQSDDKDFVIQNTIKRLPVNLAIPFLTEVCVLVYLKFLFLNIIDSHGRKWNWRKMPENYGLTPLLMKTYPTLWFYEKENIILPTKINVKVNPQYSFNCLVWVILVHLFPHNFEVQAMQ